MSSTIPSLYESLKEFMPWYIIMAISVEYLLIVRLQGRIDKKEYKINILTGIVVVITQSILQIILLNQFNPWLYEKRLIHFDILVVEFLVCILLYTFLQYFTHLLSHKVRLFWCLHEVHHSSKEITISSGLRNSVFDIMSTDVFYLLIPWLGIHPMIYFIVYTFAKIWGTFIHISEHLVSDIPWMNRWIVDPKTHHLHHARNPIYIDKNFCETIVIYDKFFGTYVRQTEAPIYGSSHNPSPTGFWNVQLNEFKLLYHDLQNSRGIIEALNYIFRPPGWQPTENKSVTIQHLE